MVPIQFWTNTEVSLQMIPALLSKIPAISHFRKQANVSPLSLQIQVIPSLFWTTRFLCPKPTTKGISRWHKFVFAETLMYEWMQCSELFRGLLYMDISFCCFSARIKVNSIVFLW